jgi:hypothetical protein
VPLWRPQFSHGLALAPNLASAVSCRRLSACRRLSVWTMIRLVTSCNTIIFVNDAFSIVWVTYSCMGGYCEFGTKKVVDVTVVYLNTCWHIRQKQPQRISDTRARHLGRERKTGTSISGTITEYQKIRGSTTGRNAMARRTSVFVTWTDRAVLVWHLKPCHIQDGLLGSHFSKS